jgi:hypothetical protein
MMKRRYGNGWDLSIYIYAADFDAPLNRWDKCINVGGGYAEKYIFFPQIQISHVLCFIYNFDQFSDSHSCLHFYIHVTASNMTRILCHGRRCWKLFINLTESVLFSLTLMLVGRQTYKKIKKETSVYTRFVRKVMSVILLWSDYTTQPAQSGWDRWRGSQLMNAR